MRPRRLGPLPALASALLMLGCDAPPPEGLGVTNGSLAPCPGTPNCVHTGLRHPEGTAGMFVAGSPPGSEIIPRVREVVESMPRTTVVEQTPLYLHAEARSPVFRFVDDLEVLLTIDRELVVRSASRLGSWDLGVNRRRVERLRERLREAGVIQ